MPNRNSDVESINEVFHKEKKQKKTTDISPIAYSPIANSPIVQGSTPVNSLIEKTQDHQSRLKSTAQKQLVDRERSLKQLRNIEIDEHLNGWVMEGLVNPDYLKWVANCCHKLGLQTVNRLAINARGGKQPQYLFASLLKGNMNLKAKQDYYAMDKINPGSANAMRDQLG